VQLTGKISLEFDFSSSLPLWYETASPNFPLCS